MATGEKNPEFYGSWNTEANSCMDYLHAVIADGEQEAACIYEYAREMPVLRDLAAGFKAGAHRIDPSKSQWFIQYPWLLIWQCRSFPEKSWNGLSPKERSNLALGFSSPDIEPLNMQSVTILDSFGILDELKDLAKRARDRRRFGKRGKSIKVDPVIQKGRWLHALFTLDSKKSKKRLRQEFELWLDRHLSKDHADCATGKTGTFLDRLKDLAVVRLYTRMGFERLLEFTNANRRKNERGAALPFHDARRPQDPVERGKTPLNQAPLCSEESYCRKAQDRVEGFLRECVPADALGASDWISKLPKISKGTF